MARRGRRQDQSVSSADTTDNARPELDGLLDPLPALPVDPVTSLLDFTGPSIPHDQRAFSMSTEANHGAPSRSLDALPSLSARAQAVPADRVQLAVCVRRKERREVMFAKRLNKRGRGGGRRSWRSDIKC